MTVDTFVRSLNEVSLIKNVFKIPYVEITSDKIKIYNLDAQKLNNRIKSLYSEKNFFRIFTIIYNDNDWKKFKQKRLQRSRMRVECIEVNLFFALEVEMLFRDLFDKYRYSFYAKIANTIYTDTWLSSKDRWKEYTVDTKRLKDIEYTLKPYQLDFLTAYLNLKNNNNLDGFILSFDQGLGKTLTSVALSHVLNKTQVLIVCPNSLKGNWAYELKQYFKKYKDDKVYNDEVYIVGDKNFKFNKAKNKYTIVNLEAIPTIYPYINKGDIMIIVDESHNFRNMDGKRTKELIALKNKSKSSDVLLMSGTPIKAIPNEIIPAMMLIDPLFTEEAAKVYKAMFDVEGLMTSDIFKRRFSKIMHRKTKAEVLTLPDKIIHNMPLTLDNGDEYTMSNIKQLVSVKYKEIYESEQPKIGEYKDVYVEYVLKYSTASSSETARYLRYCDDASVMDLSKYHELDIEFYTNFSKTYITPFIVDSTELKQFKMVETRYIRLQQSCMGRALGFILPKYRAQMYIDIYEAHKETFINMIDEEEKKTVIFSPFLGVVEHIYEDLNKNGVNTVKIIGGTKDRMDIIRAFRETDDVEVIIATTQTLATGVTLTEAAQMFFFGTPWRSTDFDQCCDRIYRIGQTKDVNIYKVSLETSAANLSNRIDSILDWSNNLFTGFVEIKTDELLGEE